MFAQKKVLQHAIKLWRVLALVYGISQKIFVKQSTIVANLQPNHNVKRNFLNASG